jgi:hypothetical protein
MDMCFDTQLGENAIETGDPELIALFFQLYDDMGENYCCHTGQGISKDT